MTFFWICGTWIESVKKEWKTNLEFLNLESLALERELQDYKIEEH